MIVFPCNTAQHEGHYFVKQCLCTGGHWALDCVSSFTVWVCFFSACITESPASSPAITQTTPENASSRMSMYNYDIVLIMIGCGQWSRYESHNDINFILLQKNSQHCQNSCLSLPSLETLLTSLRKWGSSTQDLESYYWMIKVEQRLIRSVLIAITRLQILCMRFWKDGFVELGSSQRHGWPWWTHWEPSDSLN